MAVRCSASSVLSVAKNPAAGSAGSTCGTGSATTISPAGGGARTAARSPSSMVPAAPAACSSGLNSAENAGRGRPSATASTSRSTPVS